MCVNLSGPAKLLSPHLNKQNTLFRMRQTRILLIYYIWLAYVLVVCQTVLSGSFVWITQSYHYPPPHLSLPNKKLNDHLLFVHTFKSWPLCSSKQIQNYHKAWHVKSPKHYPLTQQLSYRLCNCVLVFMALHTTKSPGLLFSPSLCLSTIITVQLS